MDKQKAKEFRESWHRNLMEKDSLIITCKVTSVEMAEKLMDQMHAPPDYKPPELAGLDIQSISWDSIVLSKEKLDSIIEQLKNG